MVARQVVLAALAAAVLVPGHNMAQVRLVRPILAAAVVAVAIAVAVALVDQALQSFAS